MLPSGEPILVCGVHLLKYLLGFSGGSAFWECCLNVIRLCRTIKRCPTKESRAASSFFYGEDVLNQAFVDLLGYRIPFCSTLLSDACAENFR